MADIGDVDVVADVEQHAEAILRVCSFRRPAFEHVVVNSNPQGLEPSPVSLQSSFDTLPAAELGMLGRLPVELLSVVLRKADIQSFFRFRQVNRRARILSTELSEYKLVSKYGLEGLQALLRAELACCFTIGHLYRILVTDRCSTCGGFGGLLFLFTAERCCFLCLLTSNHYRILPRYALAKLAHISEDRLDDLSIPSLRTVPGFYFNYKKNTRRPEHLLQEETATQTLLAIGAISEDTMRDLRRRREQRDQRLMTATAFPCYSLENGALERGVCCRGCQLRLEPPTDEPDARDTLFSMQGYLSHFKQCEEAQRLWAQSDRGIGSEGGPVAHFAKWSVRVFQLTHS